MTLLIRRYRGSDLDAVCSLHRLCLAQVGLTSGDGVYYEDDFPHIEELYLAGRGEFLVGELLQDDRRRVVAMGALRRVDDRVAEMCRLRVHPETQRRGYGERVVAVLEHRAAELGYATVRCDTTLNQRAAMALYAKRGWQEIARTEVGALVVVYFQKPLINTPDRYVAYIQTRGGRV
ncbi:GNAT family N-acetyltransferase [Spongiactinospora sp. TRM90649]|uniref:GNAT family N-acetyltransferase n=1 Tax=Spongiactinospora sp. TRM90649 TaxID=3031114 RepID=UPI0023F784D1|nr:GNAT family N-acetyltransferase [Spongiactinospora sp. TRM90649]MDF5758753.1 GNAT family N-acetyltransferase [Spongiactinospora sp. TRM90649]